MIIPLNQLGLRPVCDTVPDPEQGCLISLNPRTFDSARAIHGRLDRPSLTAGIDERNVYTAPDLGEYVAGGTNIAPWNRPDPGTHYMRMSQEIPCNRGASLIQNYNRNNSQIQYYIDPAVAPPYYSPAFQLPACTRQVDYVDPMGSWKPHYPWTADRPEEFACLSWLNDSAFQREDIMARQQAKFNQTRSEPIIWSQLN